MTNPITLLGFPVLPLFAIPSAFMWLTRRVDWYAATAAETLPGEA